MTARSIVGVLTVHELGNFFQSPRLKRFGCIKQPVAKISLSEGLLPEIGFIHVVTIQKTPHILSERFEKRSHSSLPLFFRQVRRHQSEAECSVSDVSCCTRPVRRAVIVCFAGPGSAAQNPAIAVPAFLSRAINRGCQVGVDIAILNPLTRIAQHAFQAKRVLLQAVYVNWCFEGGYGRIKAIAPPVRGLSSSARSVFPLGFIWQTV